MEYGNTSPSKEHGSKRNLREGIHGQWQHRAPFKEVLEQIKRHADVDCDACMMRRACTREIEPLGRLLEIGKSSERAFARITKLTTRLLRRMSAA